MFPKIYIGKRNEKHFFLTTNEIVLQEILKEEKREKEKEKEQEREGGENRSERCETSSLLLFLPNLKWGKGAGKGGGIRTISNEVARSIEAGVGLLKDKRVVRARN